MMTAPNARASQRKNAANYISRSQMFWRQIAVDANRKCLFVICADCQKPLNWADNNDCDFAHIPGADSKLIRAEVGAYTCKACNMAHTGEKGVEQRNPSEYFFSVVSKSLRKLPNSRVGESKETTLEVLRDVAHALGYDFVYPTMVTAWKKD